MSEEKEHYHIHLKENLLTIDSIDEKVLEMVKIERLRQYVKWGDQRHSYYEWLAIFREEYAEFRCKVEVKGKLEESIEELIQCIAVLCAWARQGIIYNEDRKNEEKLP